VWIACLTLMMVYAPNAVKLAYPEQSQRLARSNLELRRQLNERFGFEGVIGNSPLMHGVVERLRQIAPTSAGKDKNRPNLYFAYGFVVANGWIVQNPSINGYSGAFGYNLAAWCKILFMAEK